MTSSKFPGCEIINLDSDDEDDVIRPDILREPMSSSFHLPPVNQTEIAVSNPYFNFLDPVSDPEPVLLDPENSFIRDYSYEVDTRSDDLRSWGYYDPRNINLGIGIGPRSESGFATGPRSGSGLGSGSGFVSASQYRSVFVSASQYRSVFVSGSRAGSGVGLRPLVDLNHEVNMNMICLENNVFVEEEEEAMIVADEEQEWENLQNAIDWEAAELVEHVAAASGESNNELHDRLQVLSDAASVVVEEGDDVGVMMDFSFNDYVASIGEFVENHAFVFDDNESVIRGSPPASKKVVEELPDVVVTLEDGNVVCAICKDDVVVEEKVKRLPCKHYYHGECIVPWLGMRNTCPVCRYELPTDNVEYERHRRRRGLVRNR